MGSVSDLPAGVAYVSALAPAGVAIVASIAAIIAWRSHVRQKRTDQRNVFWDRLVWALDQCSDQDADIYSVNMGMVVLTSLAKDSLMTAEDIEMIEQVNDIVVDRFSGIPPEEDEESTDPEATPRQQ
ncbi:hypothetical protein GCM10025781_12860 [Kocuria gwangalliensis]|uniref:Uncharacterized protein n=3 Tax=Kocuria TaxID=57493 RepID=A0ABP8WVY3_9MICC